MCPRQLGFNCELNHCVYKKDIQGSLVTRFLSGIWIKIIISKYEYKGLKTHMGKVVHVGHNLISLSLYQWSLRNKMQFIIEKWLQSSRSLKNIMKIISIGIWVFWTEIEMENCSQCTHMNRVTNEDMYGMRDTGSKRSLSALDHFLLDTIFERNEIASSMAESHISSMYS